MKWLRDIWVFDVWIIKLLLLIVFACNLGLPQGCVRVMIEDFKNSKPINPENEFKLKRFAFQKLELAEREVSSGNFYSPYDYFRDLAEFHTMRRELGVPDVLSLEVDRLMQMAHASVRRGPFTEGDIEKAREQYKEFIDPGRIPRLKLQNDVRVLGLSGVLAWFFWLYLKTIPVVLILYLIWMRDERHANSDYGPFKFPKPGRFLMLLAGYPFVLGYYIIRWFWLNGREVYAEAELRRSKRLFAYISEEDMAKIKKFAKSNLSFSEWCKQLRDLGLKPRRSFVSALLVTLVFIFFIRPLEAGVKQAKNFAGNVALSKIATSKNLPRMNIDCDKKIQPEKSGWQGESCGKDLAVECLKIAVNFLHSILPKDIHRTLISKFFREIFHVPLQVVQFEETFAVPTQI